MNVTRGNQRSDDAGTASVLAASSTPHKVVAFAVILATVAATFALLGMRRANADIPLGYYNDLTCFDSGGTYAEYINVGIWNPNPSNVLPNTPVTQRVQFNIPQLASNSHHLTWRFRLDADEQFQGTPTITDLGDMITTSPEVDQ